ncbi:notchless protein homolog, partial [Chenopodium quinoa]|uniref:notchless protein homolog n=1 Tax=Chenopodium quinoa TaxID=63459 RepID=UPI000B76C7A0
LHHYAPLSTTTTLYLHSSRHQGDVTVVAIGYWIFRVSGGTSLSSSSRRPASSSFVVLRQPKVFVLTPLLYSLSSSQDCTIKVWETKQGKLIRELKGHGHWVNSLALSTEYVLRTGAFDHTGKKCSSPEEMKEVALARYNKMRGDAPERLVSGSDDFTMFLWEPSVSKHPKARMTGHQQLVNHVYFSPDGQWVASAPFDKSIKLWNGVTGKFVAVFRGHVGPVYQISWSADSRLLLSGSKDSTLKIWDIRTQKLKQDLPGHADEVGNFNLDWTHWTSTIGTASS